MRTALAIAGVELKRFVRDRGNIFFVLILPLMLVFVVGSQFGGSGPRGSVTVSGPDSDLRASLVSELKDAGLDIEYAEHEQMLDQVARGRTSAGIIVDEPSALAYGAGDPVELSVVIGSGAKAEAVVEQVRVALSAVDLHATQIAALTEAGVSAADAAEALDAARVAAPTTVVTDVDQIAQQFRGLGRFDLGASSQLLLFTFLTSLAGAATLISARRIDVMARALAAPTSTLQVILGQSIGRWVIAFSQGAYIMLGSWLIFGVDWGNVALSLLILAVFALVAAGAAMVLGSVLDNVGAALGAGIGIGLVLAAIGGGMVPLEVLSGTMRDLAHSTPHGWAYDAFAQVQRHDGTALDILPMLGVLAAMATVLLGLGSWLLRRSLARAL